MEIDKEFWTTVFFTILNILVLYFILKKILFKPVTNYMENRSNKIKEALDMAKEAKEQAAKMEEEHQKRLKELKEESLVMMQTYQTKAQKEYEQKIEQAKEDAKQMLENSRKEFEKEKEQMLVSLKKEVTDMVIEASSKILNKNIDSKVNRELIEQFIKEEK